VEETAEEAAMFHRKQDRNCPPVVISVVADEDSPSRPTVLEASMSRAPLRIEVWSDYVCPFCYLELPELARLARERPVEVIWRAFELRPEPAPTLDPDGAYLHRVWNASVYPMARERGMALTLPPVQPRSRKAFEAAAFARDRGAFDAMHAALFRAFFAEGRDLADETVLAELAASVGLDAQALREALRTGRYTRQVLDDRRRAEKIGVTGVPAMLMHGPGDPVLVSGAQPFPALARLVDTMRAETA
jgi:predicted DsbA family dithiol-disulfide isomerase